MNNSSFDLILVLGGIFSLLAALMAYLITYNEWVHHYPTKKQPRKIALEAAAFAFFIFLLIAVFTGLFFKP